MAATQIGESYVLVGQSYRVDPVSGGVVLEQEYDGTGTSIDTLTAALVAQGARVSKTNAGGVNRVIAQWSRDPSASPLDEVPADIWDDDTVTEEVSLFDMLPARIEAESYVTTALYKKDIEDAIANGDAYPLDATAFPVGNRIYRLLAAGISTMPVNRPILTRNRTFSALYTPRNQMEYRQTVWTTAALIAAFSIPTAVQNRFPETPSAAETPEGTVWGWKLTVDRSSYNVGTNRIQEVRTWTFAAWVESFFTVVTA